MWKKIVYYSCMIVVGISFMFMFVIVEMQNRMNSFISKSVKSGDYTNILRSYTRYSNSNPVYETVLSDNNRLSVYESAYIIKTPTGENEYDNLFDIEYSLFIEGEKIISKNQVDNSGIIYNKKGFRITNSENKVFNYYDNHYEDGYTNKNDNLYDGFDVDINTNELTASFTEYFITYDLLDKYSSFDVIDIKKIEVIDAVGNTYAEISFDSALSYDSVYLNKLKEIKPYYNNMVINGEKKAYVDFYNTWIEEYKAIDGALISINVFSKVINASFWFKTTMVLILFIAFILVIGDFIVGKRRILALFANIKRNRANEEGSFVKGAPKNNKSTNEVKDVTSGINKNNAIDVDTKDKEDD